MKKRLLSYLPVLAVLLSSLPLLFGSSPAVAASCGSSTNTGASTGASPQIAHAPTISLETVVWGLAQRHSPLTLADARFVVQSSRQTNIDDAFALAVWAAETQDGADPVPGTHNIGNITAPQGVAWAHHIFAIYPTWQAGIAAWFALIDRLYVHGGHATDLLTFALYYVHGLTPDGLTPQAMRAIAGGYVHTLTTVIATLQQHEAALHPGQSGAGTGNTGSPGTAGSSSTTSTQTLASLLPTGNLPPGWAGPGTRPAAATIKVTSSCGAAGANLPPLVLAALQLGVYLRPNAAGIFDHWVANTPDAISSPDGPTWDTDFIASVYQHAAGKTFPTYAAAAFWWNGSPGNQPGWTRIPAGPGQFPQAGDIAVLLDGARGEVALVVGVQLPKAGHPGFVLVLEGHAQHVLERWTLQADGTVLTGWSFLAVLQGYLRPPAS